MGVTKEELAALSREDLERALEYYQPRFHTANQENIRLKNAERMVTRMKYWRRLRWAITGK